MAITTLNNRSINRSDTASADQVWTATSATASDFQAAAAGGKVLQVVSTTKTDTFSTTSGSFADITGVSASITPAATSSKILIFGTIYIGNTVGDVLTKIVRDSTDIGIGDADGSRGRSTTAGSPRETYELLSHPFNYLDSPSTTSSTTYKIQIYCGGSSQTVYVNRSYNDADNAEGERTVSTITLMEIGA